MRALHRGNRSFECAKSATVVLALILPVSFYLPAGFELGAMTEADFNRNSDDASHHQEWINSVTLGHDLIPEKVTG
jgi:hypothetical protein